MLELYGIVNDYDNAMIITLITIALICIALLVRIWKIAGLTGRKFSTWEWCHIYFFSIVIFFCGILTFAKFLYSENADKLLELIYLDRVMYFITKGYQEILLRIIRALL
jgi:hypothetical protein